MDNNQANRSLVIRNSPIEFVVVGPKGKRNGVLIRSENLKTDLIGFAAKGQEIDDIPSSSFIDFLSKNPLLFPLLFPPRRMYSVGSSPIKPIKYDLDKREFEYRFYWVGRCSRSDQKSINDTFNRYVADLLIGIQEGDIEQVEWSISPTILRCSQVNARLNIEISQYSVILGIYIMAALIFLIQSVIGFYTR